MSRPRIYPPRTSLHLKVSYDVMQALNKYKLAKGVSLNKAVDDLLRSSLIKPEKLKVKVATNET